jgi:glycosyltransferase involved in cell wall biosynthesis
VNITMFAPRYYPYIGGVERHVRSVCRALVALGHQVLVITPRFDVALEVETLDDTRIRRMPRYRRAKIRVLQAGMWLWRYRREIKSSQAFHFHDADMFRLCYLPLSVLFPAVPAYITFHGYEGFPIPQQAIRIRRQIASQVRGSIAIGCGSLFDKWYGTHSNFVIPGGVDLPAPSSKPITHDAVFVGRLSEDTGIREYLQALVVLKQKHKIDITLQVCGDGPLRNELVRQSQEDHLAIQWHGFVADPEDFIERSRLAFVTGYLSVLEAMVRRKPVFSIYSDPFRKDYLSFIPVASEMHICGTEVEMAQSVADYLRDPQVNLERTYEWASHQTWDHVARTYLALYELK